MNMDKKLLSAIGTGRNSHGVRFRRRIDFVSFVALLFYLFFIHSTTWSNPIIQKHKMQEESLE